MKRDEEEEKVEQVETLFLKSCSQWRKYEILIFMKYEKRRKRWKLYFSNLLHTAQWRKDNFSKSSVQWRKHLDFYEI